MDDDVHRRADLLPDRLQGKPGGALEHHGFQAAEHVISRVCVAGGEGAVVTGVHGLEHVQGLRPTDLAHHDAVRPHPQGGLDQVPDGDGPRPIRPSVPGLQADQVVDAADLELRGVLDGDDSLIPGDEVGKSVEEGGLTASRAAADEDVIPGPDEQLQHLRRLRRNGTVGDELLYRHGLLGKTTDGDDGPVEGHGRHDHIDPGAILQMGVHNGLALIDGPPGLGDELCDDGFQLLAAFKVVFQAAEPSGPLHEDVVKAVDHHLRHLRVADDLAQDAQAPDGLKDRGGDVGFLFEVQRGRPCASGLFLLQHPDNQAAQFLVLHDGEVRIPLGLRLQKGNQIIAGLVRHTVLPPSHLEISGGKRLVNHHRVLRFHQGKTHQGSRQGGVVAAAPVGR